MKDYRKAKKLVDVSVGESVRILRELQEMSQNELSEPTGIPQSTISAIENDRVNLGVEKAKILARALQCHPAVLVFPGWGVHQAPSASFPAIPTTIPMLKSKTLHTPSARPPAGQTAIPPLYLLVPGQVSRRN